MSELGEVLTGFGRYAFEARRPDPLDTYPATWAVCTCPSIS